jgi:hypothetical protein
MPEGSSSLAPVTNPGPMVFQNRLIFEPIPMFFVDFMQ